MQLKDDDQLRPLIDFIQKNKSKHIGIMLAAAKKIGIHQNHATKVGKGNAPYTSKNIRSLRSIANIIYQAEKKNEALVSQTVESLPAA